jgi:hypothetical protein
VQETSTLKSTDIPKELIDPIAYGITLIDRDNQVAARRSIDFLLSPKEQEILPNGVSLHRDGLGPPIRPVELMSKHSHRSSSPSNPMHSFRASALAM